MMKTKATFIFILFVNNFYSSCQTKDYDKESFQGFLSYRTFEKVDFKQLYKGIVELDKLLDEKENINNTEKQQLDSLSREEVIEKLFQSLNEFSETQKSSPFYKEYKRSIESLAELKDNEEGYLASDESIDYYFFKDTVRINEPIMIGDRILKTVFIPKKYKKYRKATHSGKTHRDILNYKKRYERWNTRYTIKVDKNDTKSILSYKGYKVVISEKRKSEAFSDTYYHNVYELYVSDSFQYPFNYYSFLGLSKNLDLKGLILECKIYDADDPKSYSLLRLSDFNSNKQDRSLIKLDLAKFKKEEF